MLKVKITSKAYNKIRYYVEGCPNEISGFGKVRVARNDVPVEYEDVELGFGKPIKTYEEIGKETVLEIYDVEILKQRVSAADAEIDEEELARFLTAKIKAGENPEEYRLWWHSHAAMKSFFSITDENTIEGSTEFPWLLSLVTNHAGEIKCRLDFWQPLRVTIEDIDVEICASEDPVLRTKCKAEIKRKVTNSFPERKWKLGKKKGNVELIHDEV